MTRTLMIGSAALIGLAAFVAGAMTQASDTPRSATPAIVTDAAVRDWLSTHPEVIDKYVRASLSRLQGPGPIAQPGQRAAAPLDTAQLAISIRASHAALFDDITDGRDGAPKAAVTLIQFFDNDCVYCKAMHPTITQLLKDHPEVNVIYKEFPILSPASEVSARVDLAAAQQGKFVKFHDLLMSAKIPGHQLTEEKIFALAEESGMDIVRLKSDMAAPGISAKIAANRELANHLGIGGTPGMIIGDQLVPGFIKYDELVAMVGKEANKAKLTAVKAGN